MIVKLLLILLGIFGFAKTITLSPASTADSFPEAKNSANQEVSSEKINEESGKGLHFSQLKSAEFAPKPDQAEVIAGETEEGKPLPKNARAEASAPVPSVASSSSPATSPLAAANLGTSELPTSSPLPAPANFETINQLARLAMVNIFCTSPSGGLFKPLSASGVIIDPRGVILTNAHVAQYLLLNRYHGREFLNCVARVGSPATPAYTLSLLHISPAWVRENYKSITSQRPMGTGENDFALLTIASSTNPEISLPKTFPFLSFDASEEDIDTGKQALIAGYPAGFLGGIAIQRDLYAVSSIVSIGRLFTFRDGALDIFSLGGSPLAQRGSSGGGAIGESGKLLGIIVTSTDAEETDLRDLDAISIAHVGRSLFAETGFTLDSLLASDLGAFGERFRSDTLPGLAKLLSDELDSANR